MNRADFNNLLKVADLSKKEFCSLLSIAYPSVNNWGSSKEVPYWVNSWLKNYIKAKDMDKVVDAVKPHIKDSGVCGE